MSYEQKKTVYKFRTSPVLSRHKGLEVCTIFVFVKGWKFPAPLFEGIKKIGGLPLESLLKLSLSLSLV